MKKTLMILCGLIMSLSAFAQTSVTVNEPHMTRDALKTIIKMRPNDFYATITCSNSETAVTFIHSSRLMQATEVTLEGYYVNDMVVTKDSVFFCGKNINTERGIIGYFNIDTLFSNSGEVCIDYDFLAGEEGMHPVNELTRLDIYKDYMDVRHVFCVGTCGNEDIYPCLVDDLLNMNVYGAGYVSNKKEIFTDVKVVANNYAEQPYLATAGFDLTLGRYLNIRLYKANSVFSSGGPQDWCNLYCFESGSYARQWLDGGVLLSKIDNNTFSTVSFRTDYLNIYAETDRAKYIHLGLYDLSSIASNSVYSMLDNYGITATMTAGQEMNQFIYNSKKDAFAFLYTDNVSVYPFFESKYCEVFRDSLTASGTLQGYTNPGTRQYGLSNYYHNYNKTYVLSGHDIADPRVLKYQMNTFGVLSNCAEYFEYEYIQQKTVDAWIYKNGFSSSIRRTNTIKYNKDREYLPLYIECETE
ncbi:MAG: hypothetical protein IKP34_04545 [Bacteroidales bacterium]|nr:hypothetical protein [Bacteroidales bacterium]MBR4715427.1 hypothetical protein [Bacteroidales bacterium]